MVWQDLMFACSIYPGDPAFLRSVKAEAEFQVRRLRHRASLALWCGNNEIAQLNTNGGGRNKGDLMDSPKLRRNYEAVFHRILPGEVATHDGATPYWPSSQWRSSFKDSLSHAATHPDGEKRGDTHFCDVWHARHPVKDYEIWRFRFCSEFGLQSYSSPETNATFCPPHNDNIFGHEMENHQKNRAGNQIILDYISRSYRFPKDQECADLSLSAEPGVLHAGGAWSTTGASCRVAWVRSIGSSTTAGRSPRGVRSSSRGNGGRCIMWRGGFSRRPSGAARCPATRARSSALTTAPRPCEKVNLYTVSDLPETTRAECALGAVARRRPRAAARTEERRAALWPEREAKDPGFRPAHGQARPGQPPPADRAADGPQSRQRGNGAANPAAVSESSLRKNQSGHPAKIAGWKPEVTFSSAVFRHRFAFDLPGMPHRSSDNYFELYPDQPKTVTVVLTRPQTLPSLRQSLTYHSLVDTY